MWTGMRFLTLGVGDAFSSRWYSSSIVVESDGVHLLIDCPHPIRKILREASERAGMVLDVGNLAAVLLTHLHADHSSGLEGLGYYACFTLGRRPVLLAHPAVSEHLWDRHLRAGMGEWDALDGRPAGERSLTDYFDLRPLSEREPLKFGPFRIACRRTLHPIPTTAFRIDSGGRSLGYSADTAFDPGLITWLSEADLVVHETNYGIHTPYEKLAALPEDLRSRMRLIHYPDDFDLGASAIEPLQQGRTYEVLP
jgi:ribonuclease BN (tRNA processing enzyme)